MTPRKNIGEKRLRASIIILVILLLGVGNGLLPAGVQADPIDLSKTRWIRYEFVTWSLGKGSGLQGSVLGYQRPWFSAVRRLGMGSRFMELSLENVSDPNTRVVSYSFLPLDLTFLIWGRGKKVTATTAGTKRHPLTGKPAGAGKVWVKSYQADTLSPLVYVRASYTGWALRGDGPRRNYDGSRETRLSQRLDFSLNLSGSLDDLFGEISVGYLWIKAKDKGGYPPVDRWDPFVKLSFGWGLWDN
ncbi:MAG: hypothetical protein JXB45_01300 [Candidatus Krumholzibacteriota bacterium]|nr:hypothetical protein [Candidatus Krumholzibacteriota bacterium]